MNGRPRKTWRHWLGCLTARSSRTRAARGSRRRPPAPVESLEDRTVLSSLNISGGGLYYLANSSGLTISTTGPDGTYTFADNQPIILFPGAVSAGWTVNGDTATGPDSSVNSIQLTSNETADTFSIQSVDASVSINSGAGNDTFNIAADGIPAADSVNINNTTTNGSDGDTLTINAGGTQGTLSTGSQWDLNYQAVGHGPIDYASVKPNFAFSIPGAASNSLNLDVNALIQTPTALSTTIMANSGSLSATTVSGGTTLFTSILSLSTLRSVSVAGTSAGESLTIDYTGGDPLPEAGLTFDPAAATGGAANTLTLLSGNGGDSFRSESYNATGPGAGTITYTDSTNTNAPIAFSNLSPIIDVVPSASLTFTAPSASKTVDITTGTTVGTAQTTEINSGGTGAFESIDFANKAAATVVVNNSGATTNLFADPAAGLANLYIDSGAGNDLVFAEATQANTVTHVDTGSQPGSITYVGNPALLLDQIQGNLFVQSTGGSNSLVIRDDGETSAATYAIKGARLTATTSPAFVDFSGGGIAAVTLDASGYGDTVNVTGPAQGGVSAFTISAGGGPGPNVLNVASNSATLADSTAGTLGFGPGNPVINYTNFQTINVAKPASPPAGTGATIDATEAQALKDVVVATFTESDPTNLIGNFTASIDWGDGSSTSAGAIASAGSGNFQVLGSHTYASAGSYTVQVTLVDQNTSGSTVVSGTTINVVATGPVNSTPDPIQSTVAVASAPLTAQGATVSGAAGLPLTTSATGVLVATFMDTGTPGSPSAYSATIDWGDGTSSAATQITSQGTSNGVVFSVFGNHTYARVGTYPLTVTITKTASGATAIATGQAVIAATALTPGTAAALAASTGLPLPADSVVGVFSSSSTSEPASDFTATIDWGDGSPTSLGTVVETSTAGTFDIEGSHAYARNGTYAPTILLTQAGGPTITLDTPDTATVTVTDLALGGAADPVSAVAGTSTGPIVLATITDPNPEATASDLSATVDWGDSSATSPAAVTLIGTDASGTIFQVTGRHTYTTPGTVYPVSIDVTTIGGATTTPSPLTSLAIVADAPITATGASISGVEGNSTGPVVVATFADSDPLAIPPDFTTGSGSIVVDWGDGSAPETLPASALTSSGSPNGVLFTVTASHTYAEVGHYQLAVAITSNGGATASASGQAVIADAPLTPSPTQPTVSTTEGQAFSGAVGSFTDGDPMAPASDYNYVMIDWGDGTPDTQGTISQPGGVGTAFLVSGTHTYADAGVNGGVGHFPITISVHDAGGSTLAIANTADVADVALVVAGQLDPASDSGASDTDDITNVVQPVFLGTTNQPDATVSLYAQASSGSPVLIGQGVSNANDAWHITADQALADGSYAITAVAVDAAGETVSGTTTIVSNLVIDTAGPEVTALVFSPHKGQIQVSFQDDGGPGNAGVGLELSTLNDANNYQLVQVHHARVGKYRVNVISVTPGTTSGTQTVTLTFNPKRGIPGGWYDFTVNSVSPGDLTGVQDIAGNALDGEFYGSFPSGNGRPGGNFVAQLTAIGHKIEPVSSVIGRASPSNPSGTRQGTAGGGHSTRAPKKPKHSIYDPHVVTQPLPIAKAPAAAPAGRIDASSPGGPTRHPIVTTTRRR